MNRFASFVLFASLALVVPACQKSSSDGKVTTDVAQKTTSGLGYSILSPGNGPEAKVGQTVRVNYTGWLTDGTKFDSSLDSGSPFEFALGAGMVIKGWDEGVVGMKVGEKRKLVIPPALGYGARGAGDVIPPNATLVFEVDLVSVR